MLYLRGGHHTEGVHDAVGVLLSDLADEQCSHAGAGASSQRVRELETLQALAALGLFPHHVQDWIHQLGPLRVVTFCPVVSCPTLTWETKVKLIILFQFLVKLFKKTFFPVFVKGKSNKGKWAWLWSIILSQNQSAQVPEGFMLGFYGRSELVCAM